MTSILDFGKNKDKCQRFTPESLIQTMLDLLDYKSNLVGKTILENSFGSGNILKEIVKRYIESAINEGYEKEDIATYLGKDIYGVELDNLLYKRCLTDLDSIIKSYGLPHVDWNLYNVDALTFDYKISFDFIIGNPPYISYKEMDVNTREILKENYSSCSAGKFDYCYAFIELGINLLNDNGKLVQLIPNNIYKNVFGAKLRSMLKPHVTKILDFPNQKLFDKVLTSISVFLYDKSVGINQIHYTNVTRNLNKYILRKELGDKWVFDNSIHNNDEYIRFGDLFNASIVIATLCNKAFIVDEHIIKKEKLETEIIRKTVSPKTIRYKEEKRIIFPYQYVNGELCHYNEKEFEKKFPNITRYLKKFSKELQKRDSDKGASWFEYGRSQALAQINKKKILMSTIVTSNVEPYILEEETIPFSGIYITVLDKNYTLEDAVKILESDDFYKYVERIGISISGNSLRITCKDINNYTFVRSK